MTRLGSQSPTFQKVGKYSSTQGKDAVSLFRTYGVSFYPCQEYELDLFLARNSQGRFAARTIAISKPRQNGKSFSARHYAIWMSAVENKRVLFSAHHGKTVRTMFKALCEFFESRPDFKQVLKTGANGIYRAAGSEGIYMTAGGAIEFATRTNSGGRGGTYDVIVVDEAQELTDEQSDALKPTTLASSSGDPQMIYLGTPPNEKCPGTVFRDLHDKAHCDNLGGAWWLEWAAQEVGNPHDEDRWYQCNPALGYRIKHDVMQDAADTTREDSFAREYLGWWSKRNIVQAAINVEQWNECAIKTPPTDGIVCYAVKFSLDGTKAAIAVCLKSENMRHIELVENKSCVRGVTWIVQWLLERQSKTAQIVIDGKSKADVLEQRLHENKMNKRLIIKPNTNQFVQATSMLENAIAEVSLTHFAQPSLQECIENCPKRTIGKNGGFGFSDNGGVDPTPLEAVALAHWASVITKRNPNRKGRIG